jgi:hypothetical protein
MAIGCADERVDDRMASSGDGPAPRLIAEVHVDGVQHDLVPIGHLGGVAVRGDGTMVLRQSQDGRVRFFAADGEVAGSFGGPGEGPGEFRSIGRMGWLGDTLWVLDPQQARMTLVSQDFRLARTIIVPTAARPTPADSGRVPGFPLTIPLSPRPDGGFVAYMSPVDGPDVPEVFRRMSVYGVLDSLGYILGIHATVPVPEDATVRSADGGAASVPFVDRDWFVVAPDGRRSVLARSTRAGEAAGSVQLTVFGESADTVFSRVYPFPAVPIPAAVADSVISGREQRLRALNPGLADAFRDQVRAPANYPPIEMLLVGNDGSIWIERPPSDSGRVYFAIAPDGEPLGSLELPRASYIAAAERAYIWVLERNEVDVESLVRYRVAW